MWNVVGRDESSVAIFMVRLGNSCGGVQNDGEELCTNSVIQQPVLDICQIINKFGRFHNLCQNIFTLINEP